MNKALLIFILGIILPAICFAQKNGRFESLEVAFQNPEQVIELELWGADHHLKKLPRNISKFKNLKSIILRGNDLTTLPRSIRKLKFLEEISLGNNENLDVPTVCKILSKLPNLKELDLEKTGLKTIPEEMALLYSLKTLFVGLNGLDSDQIEELKALLPDVKIEG